MKTKPIFTKVSIVILLVLMVVCIPLSTASAFSSGTRYPATGTDVAGTGTATWTNPGRVVADDDSYATVALSASTTSHYLQGTNFGFTIPTDATITGIIVEIGRYSSGGSSPLIRDNIVRLVKAGGIVGTNNAITGTNWPGTEGIATYSPTDPLWGTTWTPAEINANNFGVVLSAINSNTTRARTGSVDYMRITVSYKLTPTLSVTNSPVTYNGSAQAATVAASVPGSAVSDIKYNGSSTIPTNAGTYAVTGDFTPTDTTNYNSLNDAVAGNFIISTKALTITAADQSKTYGDTFTFAGTEFTPDGLVNSDTVTSVSLTSAGAPASATVSGSPYTIVASAAVGTGLDNYDIDYVDGSFTVALKTLTITAAEQSKTYGDAFTFAGSEFTPDGLVNSDTVTSVSLTSAGAPATATVSGSPYAIVASAAVGTGLDNYDIAYTDGELTVALKELTITAADQSKTYGDTFTFAGTEFTAPGLVTGNGDSISSVSLTSTGAPASATVSGSPYAILASAAVGTGLDNYDITYAEGSFTVALKTLTITAAEQSKTYGDAFTFLGSEFTPYGLVNSDTVTSVTLTSAGAPASATVSGSPYAILASAAVGTGLDNYDIAYTDGELTVALKTLTITAVDLSKTYGDTFTFAGTEFAAPGLVAGNGDSISSVSLTSAGAPATAIVSGSPYAILASAAVGSGLDNYDINYVDGSFAVDKRLITVTADGKTKGYHQVDPELTYIVTGTAAGDDILTVTLTRIPGEAIGSYDIQGELLLSANSENYDLVYVGNILTIIGRYAYLPLIIRP
jgi:hypothetical protein